LSRTYSKAKDPSLYDLEAGSKPKWEPPIEENLQIWKKVKSKGQSILGRTLLSEAKEHDQKEKSKYVPAKKIDS